MAVDLQSLITKYSTSGPRYTSYPTAPQWSEKVGTAEYRKSLQNGLSAGDTLGLYVHLPFCESLCYYCGCNIQITKDHTRATSYIEALLEELKSVARELGARRTLSQIAWGGGTPTFLSLDEIQQLFEGIGRYFDLDPEAEVSIEVDPRVTSENQLKLLRELGFNRISLGVQDFDPKVQQAINRVQTLRSTTRMLAYCRELGFGGINFDLIYGLPFQTQASFERTVEQVLALSPDRVALYNYARLPGLLKHQTILEKYPMPEPDERVEIFKHAFKAFSDKGYVAIGMDHFAKAQDSLAQALRNGRLYRNFMGYTVRKGSNIVGIGASAIGDIGNAYFQNIKSPKEYEEQISREGLATLRGMVLSPDDVKRKWVIQSLMCRFLLDPEEYQSQFGEAFDEVYGEELPKLAQFVEDGILSPEGQNALRVTDLGRLFVRNVAMQFDAYLNAPRKATYSQTV